MHQACRFRHLVDLAGGIDNLDLTDAKIYRAWKDFLFEILMEMEELGLMKSIETYPLGQVEKDSLCPVCHWTAGQDGPVSGEALLKEWRALLLEFFRDFQVEGLIRIVCPPEDKKKYNSP